MNPEGVLPRYIRHEAFLPLTEQEKLYNSRILLAGCGAGSSLAPHLAKLGYGTKGEITLADPDTVDFSNLNRQEFTEASVGVNKAEALARRIHEVNSQVSTCVVPEGITPHNIEPLVSNSDVIVDMVDISKPEIMFGLHVEAQRQGKPVITGLDIGEGITSYVFDYRNSEAMTVQQFIGLPERFTLEDIERIPSFALAAQFIIGPTEKTFDTANETVEYYNTFFEHQGERLFQALPPEALPVLPKILTGEIDHIPQTDTAATLLGATHELLVRQLVLGNPVKTAPEAIRINLLQNIQP